jgi:hypothetical protein
LNGIESEGYPDKYDFRLDHLSRGENIFSYWKQNSAPPSFSFMNFKYKQDKPEVYRNTFTPPTLREDKSYRKLRLALASVLFADGAFTYAEGDVLDGGEGWMPPALKWRQEGVKVRVFDELWKGRAQQPHWLGQPRGRAVHLAENTPDLLEGKGDSWPLQFINERFAGEGVSFSREGTQEEPALIIRNTRSEQPGGMTFTLRGIDLAGRDLFVSLRLRAAPLEEFPTSVPRRLEVSAVPVGEGLSAPNQEFTWVGDQPFDASFCYQDVGPGTVQLKFEVEGEQPLTFVSMSVHSAQDRRYREYENGAVFANPSTRECTFDVESMFPGVTLRRIDGSENQDPRTNNGALVGERLTLAAKDALFVEKVQPPPPDG